MWRQTGVASFAHAVSCLNLVKPTYLLLERVEGSHVLSLATAHLYRRHKGHLNNIQIILNYTLNISPLTKLCCMRFYYIPKPQGCVPGKICPGSGSDLRETPDPDPTYKIRKQDPDSTVKKPESGNGTYLILNSTFTIFFRLQIQNNWYIIIITLVNKWCMKS